MMKVNIAKRKDLVFILAASILGLLIWLGILILLWQILKARGVSADLWTIIQSLSGAVTAAALLSAGFIAYRELSEISYSRHIEMIDRLFEELNSQENIEARRWIFLNLPENPEEGMCNLTHEGRTAMKRVLNSLDRISLLLKPGWIDEEMIMPWMNPMIVKSWDKLAPYIDYERRRRNEPDYYESARWLGEHCRAWREKNYPESKVIWVKDAL